MARMRSGCLKWLLLFALVAGLLGWLAGDCFFNAGSNLVAVAMRESKQPLLVHLKTGGWKKVTEVSVPELNAALMERHREQGFRWCSLSLRRVPEGISQRASQAIFGAEAHVLFVSPEHFDFATTFQPGFAVTTAAERLDAENLWFVVNANFREPNGKPLGWVVHEGRQVNPPFPAWTGVFFVKGGRPWCGPRSLADEVPGPIEEGVQVYPSVMKGHSVFSYVDLAPDKHFDGTKVSYRSLAGMKKDGSIVFVLSGDGGVMNVAEVTEIARKLDVQHATLMDGGRALQYSIRTGGGRWHFRAFNTRLPLSHPWLERQRSPVYLGVRKKAPRIITP